MFSTAFLDIPPLTSAGGKVILPGSKSISNRVLLLSALSPGTTTLHGLLDSDDTGVMLDALRQLGCVVRQSGSALEIDGLAARFPHPNPLGKDEDARSLFMGNAGTAIRPLTAALALLGGNFELHGSARMHERPIGDLVDALRQLGCQIDYLGQSGFPPLHIGQPKLKLDAPIQVRGDVSSQFLTALLMALPLVAMNRAPTLGTDVSSLPPEGAVRPWDGPAPGRDIVIEVVGELISRPYIQITLKLLARFGVEVTREGWQRFTIPAHSQFKSPGTLEVEADASSASYFVALGAIAAERGNKIRIEGVGADCIQGDIHFIEAAQLMGAQVRSGPNWLEVARGSWPLKAIDLDCNHIPDAAMTLALMAMYAQGTSTLRNIASWRVKETDRISAMACELRKLGATVVEGADFIRITPPVSPSDWRAASIQTYNDHRMAMCFSLAAFNPARLPVRIIDPQCVAKTFPNYFETFFSMVRAAASAIPVICIDGPTASGKGTLAAALAQQLGYHLLDSGALYRITALAAVQADLALDDRHEKAIAELVTGLTIEFSQDQVRLNGANVSTAIRTEEVGMNASKVSALPKVRSALIDLQHSFRQLPGLVADGRDMGTVVFPEAALKVFLTANAEQRAQRRYRQLVSNGISATLSTLRADLQARDARDSSRRVAPLKPAVDAMLLDNSDLSMNESLDLVLRRWHGKQPFSPS